MTGAAKRMITGKVMGDVRDSGPQYCFVIMILDVSKALEGQCLNKMAIYHWVGMPSPILCCRLVLMCYSKNSTSSQGLPSSCKPKGRHLRRYAWPRSTKGGSATSASTSALSVQGACV